MNNVNLKANSERNGAFSGDSSTNSKSFEGKVHLHRSSLSDSKDVAKVQQNSETTKDKEQKRAMETASVSHDEEHQHAVISFADAAKVQQNSEITKLSSKKELPPVTPLGTNRRGISKAA